MNTSRNKKHITLAELKNMLQSERAKAEPTPSPVKKATSSKAKKTQAVALKPNSHQETEAQTGVTTAHRQQRYEEARLLLEFLCETHPNCFNFKFRKPLKVGIDKDILAKYSEKIPNKAILANALKIYTLNIRYWKAILSQTTRVNLDGEAEGVVTEEQKLHASAPYQKALLALKERQAKSRPQAKNFKSPKVKA